MRTLLSYATAISYTGDVRHLQRQLLECAIQFCLRDATVNVTHCSESSDWLIPGTA